LKLIPPVLLMSIQLSQTETWISRVVLCKMFVSIMTRNIPGWRESYYLGIFHLLF
jgi:hypothetical protein